MVICLELGAGLHLAQLMLLPLTVSCFTKIQIGSTFLVPAHPGSPGQRAVKRVCVCVWHLLDHMQVCISLQTDNHVSTPPLSFLQARCPSCCPTNSVKALKAVAYLPNNVEPLFECVCAGYKTRCTIGYAVSSESLLFSVCLSLLYFFVSSFSFESLFVHVWWYMLTV